MKKFILCVLAVAACMTAFGQGRVFGIRAGLNVNDIKFKDGGYSYTTDSRASFNVGFAYQQPILRSFPLYLETGLYLSSRGGTTKEYFSGDIKVGKIKFNMQYFQIPAAISLHFDFNKFSVQPLVGIYYSLGIHGNAKIDGKKVDLFRSEEYTKQSFKRSDFGVRFGANFTYQKHYNISLGYDLGLMNISKESDDDKAKNRSFYVSLGYNF